MEAPKHSKHVIVRTSIKHSLDKYMIKSRLTVFMHRYGVHHFYLQSVPMRPFGALGLVLALVSVRVELQPQP